MALGGWVNSANADEGITKGEIKVNSSKEIRIESEARVENVYSNESEVSPFYYGEYKGDYNYADLEWIDYTLEDSKGTRHELDYIGLRDYADDKSFMELVFRIKSYGTVKDYYVGYELFVDNNNSLQYAGTVDFTMDDNYSEWQMAFTLNKRLVSNQEYLYFRVGIAPDATSQTFSDGYCIKIWNPYYTNVPDGWFNTGFNTRFYKYGQPYMNQWYNEYGNWYYFDGDGNAIKNNTCIIDGKTYIFDSKAVMLCKNGWIRQERVNQTTLKPEIFWYWGNGDGTVKTSTWQRVNSTWYYLDNSGLMKTGWLRLNGVYYYMNNNGEMTTGWQLVDGKWYYLDVYGAMQTGWERVNSRWYYLRASGEMAIGWQAVDGKWYYLNSYGEMQTGWVRVNNSWYYLNAYGEMATGWVFINNNWYYMYSSGVMATNTVVGGWKIDGYGIARQ